MRMLRIIVTSTLLLLPASPRGVQALQRLMDVQQIPSDTLRDVALVTYQLGRPVIYYNPILLQRVGPQLSAFFIAHEYGHIHGGHTGGALLHDGELSALRRKQELEADCYAAAVLAEQNRDAVVAALRFFTRLGPLRHDNYHPSGSQRAARILSCLPPEHERAEAVEPETSSGSDPSNVTFQLRAPSAQVDGYAVEAKVWIDEASVGTVSSLRQPGRLEVRRFAAGSHRYRVSLTVYDLDSMLQLTPGGTVSGEGLVTIRDGDVVSVRWSRGETPVLVRQ